MTATTDPDDPRLHQTGPDGQNEAYLVLPDDERAKAFVRPVRDAYSHDLCGTTTKVGREIAETYARDPKFYNATYCVACKKHFPLRHPNGKPAFFWEPDGQGVGE